MSLKPLEIVFITGNSHKFLEIETFIKNHKLNIILTKQDLNPIEIQSDNLEQVAKFKISSIKDEIHGNFMIEDAGFFVESLNGFPGVYSSYIMKMIGNSGILKLMKDQVKRNASFRAIIALYLSQDDEIHYFSGEVKGKVAFLIRGKNGFGYDPIFIPDEMPNNTFGEISIDIKNTISHRFKAISKLIDCLKNKGY